MSSGEIDDYLAGLEEPKRSTLQHLRETILSIVPTAEEGMYYQLPAFWLDGKAIAGFAAFKTHLSYLPHSGSVISVLGTDVANYKTSKGCCSFRSTFRCPEFSLSVSSMSASLKRGRNSAADSNAGSIP